MTPGLAAGERVEFGTEVGVGHLGDTLSIELILPEEPDPALFLGEFILAAQYLHPGQEPTLREIDQNLSLGPRVGQ